MVCILFDDLKNTDNARMNTASLIKVRLHNNTYFIMHIIVKNTINNKHENKV